MSWTHAPAAKALLTQANERWPNRNRASDGSIGDAAHSARTSDHNPRSDGVVMATDVTHDPANGLDAHAEARRIAERRDPRVKYIISNGQIWSTKRASEGWRHYTGSNKHTKHVHFSITAGHEDDTSPWYADAAPTPPTPDQLEDDDMAMMIKHPSGAVAMVTPTQYWDYTGDEGPLCLHTINLFGMPVREVSDDQWNWHHLGKLDLRAQVNDLR